MKNYETLTVQKGFLVCCTELFSLKWRDQFQFTPNTVWSS